VPPDFLVRPDFVDPPDFLDPPDLVEPLDLVEPPDLAPAALPDPWRASCWRRLRTSFSISSSASTVVFWSHSLKLSSCERRSPEEAELEASLIRDTADSIPDRTSPLALSAALRRSSSAF
jgi:hypothetical protein